MMIHFLILLYLLKHSQWNFQKCLDHGNLRNSGVSKKQKKPRLTSHYHNLLKTYCDYSVQGPTLKQQDSCATTEKKFTVKIYSRYYIQIPMHIKTNTCVFYNSFCQGHRRFQIVEGLKNGLTTTIFKNGFNNYKPKILGGSVLEPISPLVPTPMAYAKK